MGALNEHLSSIDTLSRCLFRIVENFLESLAVVVDRVVSIDVMVTSIVTEVMEVESWAAMVPANASQRTRRTCMNIDREVWDRGSSPIDDFTEKVSLYQKGNS